MGITLTHEHFFIDASVWMRKPRNAEERRIAKAKVNMPILDKLLRNPFVCRDNLILNSVDLAVCELKPFKEAGGSTIMDATPYAIGGNPAALKRVAQRSGVQIIAGCGYYVQNSHPRHVAESTVEGLEEEIVEAVRSGIGTSGVKAGHIGEIGASPAGVTAQEARIFRAAARAHKRTRVPIITHSWQNTPEKRQQILDLLEKEDADLGHVLMHTMDNVVLQRGSKPDDYWSSLESIAERGSYLGFDSFGMEFPIYFNCDYGPSTVIHYPTDYERAVRIKELIGKGFLRHIVVSHDVCLKVHLRAYGGWGYAHLLTDGKNIMQYAGISEKEYQVMLVQNPRQLYASC